jgi:putative ABC transport system permease protein
MFKFIPYIWKNLRRHRARTVMTVGGTALLMFLFGFVTSVQEGLARLTDPSRHDNRLIVFQAFRFCPSTSQLPYPLYENEIRKVPGVKDVLPIKVIVNNCRASLDAIVFHGVPPERLRTVRHLTLLQGDWDAFERRRDGGAIVGRKVAERRAIVVGKPFTIAGMTVNVEGIFASDLAGEENLIYTHLGFLQTQAGEHQDVSVTMYEVHTDDPMTAESVGKAIDDRIRADGYPVLTDTKPQRAFYSKALADLVGLIDFIRWLGFLCVGVVGILVANSVIMAAQDRIKEHAVLQTIGYSGSRIFRMMMTESMLISVTGGGIGLLLCLGWLIWRPPTLATEGVSVDFLATPALVIWGLALSVVVGVAAGLVPAWQAARTDIVNSLR